MDVLNAYNPGDADSDDRLNALLDVQHRAEFCELVRPMYGAKRCYPNHGPRKCNSVSALCFRNPTREQVTRCFHAATLFPCVSLSL